MTKPELKNKEKLQINIIDKTPFQYVTKDEKNYIICGKVVLKTNESFEEIKKKLNKLPWEEISLLCQAITNEMSNNKKQ